MVSKRAWSISRTLPRPANTTARFHLRLTTPRSCYGMPAPRMFTRSTGKPLNSRSISAGTLRTLGRAPLYLRREWLCGHILRLDVDRNVVQAIEHFLRGRTNDDHLRQHLLSGIVITVGFERQ